MSENEALVFEVSKSNFNTAVILNSHKIPVFVVFMGVWSEHCISLEYLLSEKAREFAGQFIFAKLDVDAQRELMKEYGVSNLPTLKVFKDGEVVRTEEGLMQEVEIRALLKDFGIFRESDELCEQARQKHITGDTLDAISILTRAIKLDPANTRVAMDMVQIFIDIGELDQADSLFKRLPEKDRESDIGRGLLGQLTFKRLAEKTEGRQILQTRLDADDSDQDARFDLAVCLVAEHDYRQAVDRLFEILEQEPDYKEGAAREMIIGLTNMLAPNDPPLAQEFRRRLGNVLS